MTEIYASGYSTLFQSGTVAETLDLTNFGNDSIATYSRVYHAAPRLQYQQMNMMGEEFLGIKQYVAMDIAGTRDTITVVGPEGAWLRYGLSCLHGSESGSHELLGTRGVLL